MKKFVSLALVVLMTSVLLIAQVSAAPNSTNYGSVKKVSDSDIDMSKAEMSEPAWQNATKVTITRNRDGNSDAAKGDVYLLWSDTAYYVFFDITDSTPVSDPDRPANLEPWVTDSVEIFIDNTNEGTHCEQFRVDRDGVPSYYPKDGAWPADMLIGTTQISDNGPVPAEYYSWVVKTDGNKYYVKLKITFFGNISSKALVTYHQKT